MTTTILIYYPYLDGTSTSLIDLYYNLLLQGKKKVFINIIINTREIKTNVAYLQSLKQSLPSIDGFHYISFKEATETHYDNLIISFGIFRFLQAEDIQKLHFNTLQVLDAGRIFYDYYCNDCKNINFIKSINAQVYGNKRNQYYFDNYDNYHIYYHKFSHQRLDFLKTLPQTDLIITEDIREKTGNIKFNAMTAKELHYNRWREINGLYSENIGKMIFEFSVLGKKVFYSNKNKTNSDGLTEYLRLFNIDDNISQEIHITEEQLFNVLKIEDDELINICE